MTTGTYGHRVLVLAVDTATPRVTAGVVELTHRAAPRLLAEAVPEQPRRHAELLVPAVRDVLRRAGAGWHDLAAVVVGEGPGGWTGLRVGLVSAQTWGEVRGLAVVGVSTLDALAAAPPGSLEVEPPAGTPGPGRRRSRVVVLDARRREVFWRVYGEVPDRTDGVLAPRPTGPAQVGPPADLLGRLDDDLPEAGVLLGPGARAALAARDDDLSVLAAPGAVAAEVDHVPAVGLASAAAALVREAVTGAAPGPVRPSYLRRPDATPAAPRRGAA